MSAGSPRSRAIRCGALYLVKAVVLVGLLYILGRCAGSLPAGAVAAVWAVLSAVSTLGPTYRSVVNRTIKQQTYEGGGYLARRNNKRVLRILAAFAVSAVCVAGLVFETPRWDAPEWCLVAAAVPVYLLVFLCVRRFVDREYRPAFRTSKAIGLSTVLTGALLCMAYLVLCLVQPVESFESAAAAFDAAACPFEGSPSALMREAGTFVALSDGLVAYGASRAAEASNAGYLAIEVVLSASAFFGVANLLGLCSLGWSELRRVFLPLEAPASEQAVPIQDADPAQAAPVQAVDPAPANPAPLRSAVVSFVALPVLLATAFLVADAVVARAERTEEFTAVERFVRDQVGLAVFVLDGRYYDQAETEALLEETRVASESLSKEAAETLVPLINASFDTRLANVDAYLDWYYSLPGDYERLVTMVTGTVEDFMQEQFVANIEASIDDSALEDALQGYAERATALKEETAERLEQLEITGLPAWLFTEAVPLGDAFASDALASSEGVLSAGERWGVSIGAAAGTGFVAKHLAEKAVTKPFFQKFVSKVAGKIGGRAVSTAVGGAVGTIAGPLGTAVGAVAGTAVGLGIDYGMVKFDEWQNRESYKEEIVQLIEEERSEMLAAVQGEPEAQEETRDGSEAQDEPEARDGPEARDDSAE